MSWDTRKEGDHEKTYYIDDENPTKEVLVFDLDKGKNEILYYPKDGSFFLKEVLFKGFDEIPHDLFSYGSLKSGLQYFLTKRFESKGITRFEISAKDASKIKVAGKSKKLIFSYEDFTELAGKLSSISYEARVERGEQVDSSFFSLFPKHFSKADATKAARNKTRRFLKNLDPITIDELKNQEAQKVVDYFVQLIEKRSTQQSFFNLAKLKIDEVSIDHVIELLKKHISSNSVESEWAKFLIENLFIIDSKYVYAIPEINLTLGGSRRVDFGLIDSDGYLDIFEIKRPNTKLFEPGKDHGNYYWHKDAVRAIVQAEKYLHSANRKGAQLVEDLQRERSVELPFKVIKPRIFLIMGISSQLVNQDMRDDFQILRRSQRNVDIILYDDFLKKIENQRNKVFLTTPE